jgi:toxin FitB
MTGFLLDTNIISELIKPRPDRRVTAWIEATDEQLFFLSVLSLGEIRKGITSLAEMKRRAVLEAWLDRDLVVRFSGRILPIDHAIADRWGQITGTAAARKTPVAVIDGLLAASALQHDLVLVTRNTKHLSAIAVPLFNPWHE